MYSIGKEPHGSSKLVPGLMRFTAAFPTLGRNSSVSNSLLMYLWQAANIASEDATTFKELVRQTFARALPERLELAQEIVNLGARNS